MNNYYFYDLLDKPKKSGRLSKSIWDEMERREFQESDVIEKNAPWYVDEDGNRVFGTRLK